MLNESLDGAVSPPSQPIRVLLVDDTAVVLQTLRWRLEVEPDIQVVGQATQREEALALAPAVEPDVIVLDLNLPGVTDLSLACELRWLRPQSALVILSAEAKLDRLRSALES